MDETTKKEFKDILQAEFETQFKKELEPIHAKLDRLDRKADNTVILVSNLAVDMVDVPDNIKEILRRQRHTETHIDWLAKYHKDEEADEKVNFRLIEQHKEAIMLVAESTDVYKGVKEILES